MTNENFSLPGGKFVPILGCEIDANKIKTLEDVILVIRALKLTIHQDNEFLPSVVHLLRTEDDTITIQ